jgi:uncharacterized membrane protein
MLGYDWPRLHAALNDLPIAMLLGAALFDVLAIATKRESFRVVSFWTLVLGAVGGVAAVVSGLQAEEHIAHGDAVHRVMETHETLGLITLGIFGVLAVWRIVRERRMGSGERTAALILTLAGAGVLFTTGLYGGRLVFEHAAGIPTPVLKGELKERGTDHHHDSPDGHDSPEGHDDPVVYDKDLPWTGDSSARAPAAGHVDPPGTPPHEH